MTMNSEHQLSDWRDKALHFERQINQTVIGQQAVVRHLLLAVFARGHVLLEGQVGVGKRFTQRRVTANGRHDGVELLADRIDGTLGLGRLEQHRGVGRGDPLREWPTSWH